MATSDPIKDSQLVDPSAFPALYENVEKLIKLILKGQTEITKLMSQTKNGIIGNTPATAAQAQELKRLIDRVSELEKAQQKLRSTGKALTIEQAKVRIELQNNNKATKDAAKEILGLTTEYQRQSKTLIDLRKAAQDVLLKNQENTTQGKAIIAQYTEMDLRLKKVDATLGVHNRVIGDYGRHVIEITKGVGGLAGLLGTIGKAFGIETEAIEESIRIGRESLKVSRELLNIKHGEKEAEEDLADVKEANIELSELQIAANEEQAAATLDAAAATDVETVSVEELNVALMANPVVLVIAAIAALAAGLGYLLSTTEDNVDQLKAFNKAMDDELKAIDENIFGIQKLAIEYDVLSGKIDKYEGKRKENGLDTNKRLLDSDKRYKEQKASMYEEFQKTQEGVFNSFLGVMGTATASSIHAANLYASELKTLEMVHNTEQLTIKTEAAAKATNITQEQTNEELKAHDEKLKKLLEEEKRYEEELRKFREEMIKLEHEQEHEKIIFDKEQSDEKIKNDAEALDKQQMAQFEANNKLIERLTKEQKERDAWREKQEAEEKKKREEEVQASQKLADDLVKIEENHISKMQEIRLNDINNKLAVNKSAIEVQLALAATGKKSTLAYELNKQDELEKSRQQELQRQKKIAKEEEALELSLAFLKAYETYISNGTKSGKALGMASRDVLAAKLLSKAIAGTALDGTENTGKAQGGGLDGKGGMLWMIHEEEGVATKKANKKYKGAIGAMNKGTLEQWSMQNIMKSNYDSTNYVSDVNTSSQVNDALSSVLVNEIKNLAQVIKDKPENSSSLDGAGKLIKTRIEKGLRTITIKKTYLD